MPIKGDAYRHGDLYVSFEVIYPKTFQPETLTKLKEILPKGLLPKTKETKNTYELEEDIGKSNNHAHHGHHEEEEEEYGHGGQRVECNQQ